MGGEREELGQGEAETAGEEVILLLDFLLLLKSTLVFLSFMSSCMLLRTLGSLPLQALIEEEALASSMVQNLPLPYFALNTFCKASAKFQLQRIARGLWSHFN